MISKFFINNNTHGGFIMIKKLAYVFMMSFAFFMFPEKTLADSIVDNSIDSNLPTLVLKKFVEPESSFNEEDSGIITPYANVTVVRNTFKQEHNTIDDLWGGLYDITYKELSYRNGYDYLGYVTLSKTGFWIETYFFQDTYRPY